MSSLGQETIALTHEVLLSWTAQNATQSKPEASATNAETTSDTASAVTPLPDLRLTPAPTTPVSEQKRSFLRVRGNAVLVPEAEKVTLAPASEAPATENRTEKSHILLHADEMSSILKVVHALEVANGTGTSVLLPNSTAGSNRTKIAAALHSDRHEDPLPDKKDQEFLLVCFAVASLIMTACCFFAWYVGHDKDEKEDVPPPLSPRSTPKTHANLLTALKCADGTWTQNYEGADEKRKAALELLFRCNIVPVQEFAHSRVNQDHVDECVWIATHMLKKKSLEEWVQNLEQARKTFEDDVTACFKARIATKESQNSPTSPSSVPSSRFGGMDGSTSGNNAFARQSSPEDKHLLGRCREIMSLSRQLHTPRESRSGFRTVEPPQTSPGSRPVTPRAERPLSPRSMEIPPTDLALQIPQTDPKDLGADEKSDRKRAKAKAKSP